MAAYKDIDKDEILQMSRLVCDRNDTKLQQGCSYCHKAFTKNETIDGLFEACCSIASKNTLVNLKPIKTIFAQKMIDWTASGRGTNDLRVFTAHSITGQCYECRITSKTKGRTVIIGCDLTPINYCSQCGRKLKKLA